MNINLKRGLLALGVVAAILGGTAACTSGSVQSQNSDKMMDARNDKIDKIVLCGNPNDSNTCKNLAKHVKRNEDPNRLTYIYLVNLQGDPYAYYVAKGPVTSTTSQMAPMDQVLDINPRSDTREWTLAEAPGDDGSSGSDLPGLFFYDQFDNEIEIHNISVIFSDAPFDLPGVKEIKVKR